MLQEFAPEHGPDQAGKYAYGQAFPRLLPFLGFRVSEQLAGGQGGASCWLAALTACLHLSGTSACQCCYQLCLLRCLAVKQCASKVAFLLRPHPWCSMMSRDHTCRCAACALSQLILASDKRQAGTSWSAASVAPCVRPTTPSCIYAAAQWSDSNLFETMRQTIAGESIGEDTQPLPPEVGTRRSRRSVGQHGAANTVRPCIAG